MRTAHLPRSRHNMRWSAQAHFLPISSTRSRHILQAPRCHGTCTKSRRAYTAGQHVRSRTRPVFADCVRQRRGGVDERSRKPSGLACADGNRCPGHCCNWITALCRIRSRFGDAEARSPSPTPENIRYGGSTACVELQIGRADDHHRCGIRHPGAGQRNCPARHGPCPPSALARPL
jgi:hypothetical protein